MPTVAPGSGAVDAVGVVHGGLLLTVTGYLEGEPGPGEYADDNQRSLIAGALGALHADRPPERTALWRPGPRSWGVMVQSLESPAAWRSGPFGGPVRAALREHDSMLRALHGRYLALAAQALEGRAEWVLTHGRLHTGNVLWLAGGPVLVDWESLRVAPRERDLRTVLRGAHGVEPLSAYTAHGGRADLDDDLVELFDLDEWLGAVARAAARFAGPHAGDGEDEHVRDALLEELAAR